MKANIVRAWTACAALVLWSVAFAASDTFNSDVNPLASPWTGVSGGNASTLKALSGVAVPVTASSDSWGRYSTSTATLSRITIGSAGDCDGGPAMMNTSADGYVVSCNGGNLQLHEVTDGAFSAVSSTAYTASNGDTIELDVTSPTNVVVNVNGGGAEIDVAEATYRSGLAPGIFIFGTITVTDWTDGASAASPTLDQEGFRWGVDDGNEASHTFEAAQDTNISIADNQSRLLRTLVNATLDPASAAYTLRYQKNGSGGYVAVPVGSTTPGSISNQLVAASSDDAQQSGTTVTLNGTTIGASLDATTEWAAMRFTNIGIPVGATITSAAVGVVPSGTGEDEPLVTVFFENADDCATFTTTASDISNRARTTGVSWSSADLGATGSSYHSTPDLTTDVQAVINRAGWASGNAVCVIIQGGSTATRDLTIEAQDLGPNTNPPRLSVAWTTPNEVYITTSANIAAGGEATTARLAAPSGKTTSDFVTGRRWDDENGTDTIDITTDDYTEVEWLVFIASSAADGDFFDFRTYAGSSPLDTYTVTGRWTIPVPGGGSIIPLISNNRRRQMH